MGTSTKMSPGYLLPLVRERKLTKMVPKFHVWIAVFVFVGLLTVSDGSKATEQVNADSQVPYLQDLSDLFNLNPGQTFNSDAMDLTNSLNEMNQAMGANVQSFADGQSFDPNNLIQPADPGVDFDPNNHFQPGDSGVNFDPNTLTQLANSFHGQFSSQGSKNAENGVMTVMVETKSLDDLLAAEAGKHQLGQLNAQLEQAMNSLHQGVLVMEDKDPAMEILNTFDNLNVEQMLGRTAQLLYGLESGGLIQAFPGIQSLQSANCLLETLQQLPILKGLLDKLITLAEKLQTSSPAAVKGLHQIFTAASVLLREATTITGNGEWDKGHAAVMQMFEDALESLNSTMVLLETTMAGIQRMINSSTFLQDLNDIRCLMGGLTSQHHIGVVLGCSRRLLQSMTTSDTSDETMTSTTHLAIYLLQSPRLMQSLADFFNRPHLDKAFDALQMLTGNLNTSKADLNSAMQVLHTTLKSLLSNQNLMKTVTDLLQNPETRAIYDSTMEILRNATQGDQVTGQLLVVVNDTVTWMQRDGDFNQLAQRVKDILKTLMDEQDPNQPLSETQQELLTLLDQLLDLTLNTSDAGNDSSTHQSTNAISPNDTSTPVTVQTTRSSVSTTQPQRTESSPVQATGATTTPTTETTTSRQISSSSDSGVTRIADPSPDGSNHAAVVSFSGISLVLAVTALRILV